MRRPTPLPTLYVEPRFPIGRAVALLLALAACLLFLGPGLDELDAMRATQRAKQDAQRQAQQTSRLERAARAMCGRHGWQLIPERNTVQCGKRTP